jgi:hypothetical protein
MPAVLPILLTATALWTAPCPTAQPLAVTTLCLINHVRAEHGAPRLRALMGERGLPLPEPVIVGGRRRACGRLWHRAP